MNPLLAALGPSRLRKVYSAGSGVAVNENGISALVSTGAPWTIFGRKRQSRMAVIAASPKAGSVAVFTTGSLMRPCGVIVKATTAVPASFRFRSFSGYSGAGPRKGFGSASVTPLISFRRVEYQGSFALTDAWTAGFGAETEHSRIRYNSQFSAAPLYARTRSDAAYAQVQGDILPNVTLTAGLRYEDQAAYGEDTVGQVAAAWRAGADTIVRASYSQGFRAPGLYELYSEYGNTDLDPEEVDSYEIGAKTTGLLDGRLHLDGSVYLYDYSNFQAFVCTTAKAGGRAQRSSGRDARANGNC